MGMISFSEKKNFTAGDLEALFQSVGWLSANYPERLLRALKNSAAVYTAWDGGRLVGLVNALDDGELTAYIHYLLVDPRYQGQNIGLQLMERIKDKYKDYLCITLVSEQAKTTAFYEKLGFEAHGDSVPMALMNE